jgi:hypothetical protein
MGLQLPPGGSEGDGSQKRELPALIVAELLRTHPIYAPSEEDAISWWKRLLLSAIGPLTERLVSLYYDVPRMLVVLAWGVALIGLIWTVCPRSARRLRLGLFFAAVALLAGLFGAEVVRAIYAGSRGNRPLIVVTEISGTSEVKDQTQIEPKVKFANTGSESALGFRAVNVAALSSALEKASVSPPFEIVNPIPPGGARDMKVSRFTVTCRIPDLSQCDSTMFLYVKMSYRDSLSSKPYVEEYWYTHKLGTSLVGDATPSQKAAFEPIVRGLLPAD